MKAGIFMMPSHPPERDLREGHEWNLKHLEFADQLGFHEAWIGEHFTAPWEPNPAPDLLIAQALLCTQQMKLCPGAHLLPYHHPAELAHRVAFLDHLAQGRFMLGIGAGALPSDMRMFNVNGEAGENRRMTLEALDIMLKLWTSEEPFVAETDKEAREQALNSNLGRTYQEYLLPIYKKYGVLHLFKHQPEVPESDITLEYLADYTWLVGSPKTVTEKLGRMYDGTGGFGCLLAMTFDQLDNNERWENSQRLLMEEVMPHFVEA